MSKLGERRLEVVFALGNVLPVAVLSVGLFALPVRWWPADVVLGAAIVTVLVTSSLVMSKPAMSRRALRLGAQVLLGVGLLVIAAAVLSLAFLAGIHGDFGRGGVTLMVLVALLVLPYLLGYPVIQLLWLGPSTGVEKPWAKPKPVETPAPKVESVSGPAESGTPSTEAASSGPPAPGGTGGAPA